MNRKSGAFSSIEVSDDLRCQVIPLVGKNISHFSSVEDSFFSEGDSLSAAAESHDFADDGTATRLPRRWLSTSRSLMAAAGAVVIAGTVLLIRSGGHAAAITDDAVRPTVQASPVAEPLTPPAPAPAAPQPSPPAVVYHEPEKLPAPAPADEVLPPSPKRTSAGAAAGSEAGALEPRNMDLCKKAFDQRRYKEILSKCADAVVENPQSADAAVMLAETEFDRGRVVQALDWAKKAIAADADRADAYVFLGGAEQAAGHNAAAKAAYKRYLQLAPQGRYAGDLRSVLSTL
jgi:hypothetical protein